MLCRRPRSPENVKFAVFIRDLQWLALNVHVARVSIPSLFLLLRARIPFSYDLLANLDVLKKESGLDELEIPDTGGDKKAGAQQVCGLRRKHFQGMMPCKFFFFCS